MFGTLSVEENPFRPPRGPARQGPPQSQQPAVAAGEPPAPQCRTPPRHHAEPQDRRDHTPADRAARTRWPGRPGPSHHPAARDAKLSFSPAPSTWPPPKTLPQKSKGPLNFKTPLPVPGKPEWQEEKGNRNGKKKGRKQRRTTRATGARAYQRQQTPREKEKREKEKITRVPRERETRTHLKEVSALGETLRFTFPLPRVVAYPIPNCVHTFCTNAWYTTTNSAKKHLRNLS
ncbi:hypothetical protein TNCV_2526271 [Trichonephila clavipes]|nr:hypothetical protein TNCV_2526271 [Trichonephila clavipes]